MSPRVEQFVHRWTYEGQEVTFSWIGDADVVPTRSYALAFDDLGQMLLVSGGPSEPHCWLPGGGIEAGESPEDALARELSEEAGATIQALERLGAQRVESALSGVEHHAFYWCSVILQEHFIPKHEVAERHLVPPEAFLDTLFWGRTDPKAAMLYDRAMEAQRRYEESERAV